MSTSLSVSLMKSMMKRQEESEEVITCVGDVMLERVSCMYSACLVKNGILLHNKNADNSTAMLCIGKMFGLYGKHENQG